VTSLRTVLAQARFGKGPAGQRGFALLMALILVVLITAFVTDFNYKSRIDIITAGHHRDDVRANYLAKSGIRTYGLLLVMGRQVGRNPMAQGLLASMGMNLDGAAMVCRSIPFLDTAMLRFMTQIGDGMMSDEDEEGLLSLMGVGGNQQDSEEKSRVPVRGELDESEDGEQKGLKRDLLAFEGDFKVDCIDESSRIDLNGFANQAWAGYNLQQHPTALMLYGLMADEDFNPLFEERLKMDRWELIGNIKDWVDPDSQRSGLWGGDEDGLYDDYEPRYRSKNGRFDTVEEMRMVHGVNDEVWSLFGEAISVHTQNFKVNINSASAEMIRALIRAYSDPAIIPMQAIDLKIPELMAERIFIPYARSADFISRVQAKGITLRDVDRLKTIISTDSKVFRLSSTGYVNESTYNTVAVVRVNNNGVRYLLWKEN
jgi:type II secretory pathway component PulK